MADVDESSGNPWRSRPVLALCMVASVLAFALAYLLVRADHAGGVAPPSGTVDAPEAEEVELERPRGWSSGEAIFERAEESSGPNMEPADRIRCCDGSLSPSCTYSQGSLGGCCSWHGGVC